MELLCEPETPLHGANYPPLQAFSVLAEHFNPFIFFFEIRHTPLATNDGYRAFVLAQA